MLREIVILKLFQALEKTQSQALGKNIATVGMMQFFRCYIILNHPWQKLWRGKTQNLYLVRVRTTCISTLIAKPSFYKGTFQLASFGFERDCAYKSPIKSYLLDQKITWKFRGFFTYLYARILSIFSSKELVGINFIELFQTTLRSYYYNKSKYME